MDWIVIVDYTLTCVYLQKVEDDAEDDGEEKPKKAPARKPRAKVSTSFLSCCVGAKLMTLSL